MAVEDFFNSEVGVAVAATAVVLSPRVRGWVRRGAVYGIAGVLKASDAVGQAARNVAGEAQQTASSGMEAARETTEEAKTVARGPKGAAKTPRQ